MPRDLGISIKNLDNLKALAGDIINRNQDGETVDPTALLLAQAVEDFLISNGEI